MNNLIEIYDVYMDDDQAVISATNFDIDDEGRLLFLVEGTVIAIFQTHCWEWFEKRQVEEK